MRLAGWIFALVFFVASIASAQSTGSSAGGGSWESESSGSSGGSYGASDWSASSGGSDVAAANGYEPPFWGQCLIAFGFFLFLFVLFRAFQRLGAPPPLTVTSARIAIDARARRFVQAALAKMVADGDTRSTAGLAKLLHAATDALTASRLAWIYVGATHEGPLPKAQARSAHERLAQDARARFQTELVRKSGGSATTNEAPALTPREHEGEGVVVVTLVVATTARIAAASPASVSEIERLLVALGKLGARELVALELVWSPAAENDRMSSDELEARYPELTRLPGAVAGRTFCAYCAGPFAAELAKCPHCGAPTRE